MRCDHILMVVSEKDVNVTVSHHTECVSIGSARSISIVAGVSQDLSRRRKSSVVQRCFSTSAPKYFRTKVVSSFNAFILSHQTAKWSLVEDLCHRPRARSASAYPAGSSRNVAISHGRWALLGEPRDLRPACAALADGSALELVLRDPCGHLVRFAYHRMTAFPAPNLYVGDAGCEQLIDDGGHAFVSVSFGDWRGSTPRSRSAGIRPRARTKASLNSSPPPRSFASSRLRRSPEGRRPRN